MKRKRLKNYNELNECIEAFVSKWDLYAKFSNQFAFLNDTDTVLWTLATGKTSAEKFAKFFEDCGCNVKADIFLYSILHEIGHSQTMEQISEMDWNYSQDMKQTELTDEEYFNLPDEIAATKWAVDYLNNNTEDVKAFWDTFVPLLMKFYMKNKVEV